MKTALFACATAGAVLMAGAASEYFAVDAKKVTKIPAAMSFDEGAMLEPLAVAVHAARRFSELKGAKVAVLGAGPIGILVAVFASLAKVDLAVLNDHEFDLNTTMMYRHEDHVGVIGLVESGKVRLAPLVSKHFAFRDYAEAYRYIDANRESTMKVIVEVDC